MLRRLSHIDWPLLLGIIILSSAGLLSLASTNDTLFSRQLMWLVLSILVIFGATFIDWKWLGKQTWFLHLIYWGTTGLLLLSYFLPGSIRGTKSWIVIGGIQFEPAEFAKLALILVLAGFFSRRYVAAWHAKNIFLSFIYMAIPASLIFLHPDFGSAMVVGAIWVGLLLLSGINPKRFLFGLVLVAIIASLGWTFVLKPYQKDRLTAFLFPERDPFGISYNVIQSKIAIGSAGFFGKGFGSGTQTQLNFLPEAQTDFIFAAFVEEWGIFGGLVLLLTFLLVLYRVMLIGLRSEDNYSKFVVLGALIVLLVHFFVNVGSNVGIMPVTGIPLSFVSYGGSHMLTMAVLTGIIQRIKLESSL